MNRTQSPGSAGRSSRMMQRGGFWIGSALLMVILAAVWLGSHAVRRVDPPGWEIGRAESTAYRDLLVRSLREEGRVAIVEHSWHGDRPGSGGAGERIEYQRIELGPRLRAELARRLEAMDPSPQSAVMMCFSPHHSIEFTPAAGEPSRMLVCFSCFRVEWNRSEEGLPPAALVGLLEEFFGEIGLRPRAEWAGLAEEAPVEDGRPVRVP